MVSKPKKNKAGWGKNHPQTLETCDMYCQLHCIAVFFLAGKIFFKGTFSTQREHSVFPNWVEAITPMVRKQLLGGEDVFFFQGGKISKYISRDPIPPGFPSTRSWICRVFFFFWGGPSWKIYREQVKKKMLPLLVGQRAQYRGKRPLETFPVYAVYVCFHIIWPQILPIASHSPGACHWRGACWHGQWFGKIFRSGMVNWTDDKSSGQKS